jgi:hypothetical protein
LSFKDGQERTCDSLSLIDAVVPEIVENRRKELQQQQQQHQQSSSSSSGTSVKNDTKLSSRTALTTTSNTNDKDISSMHQPTNTSPQSTNQTISDRNMDTSVTPNGGINYGIFFR